MPVLRPEHLLHALVEVLGDLARPVAELHVQLTGGALELRLDELGVGGGLLAVEHPGADRDRVEHRLDRILAVLLALADEPDGAAVLDDEAVDREHVADHLDVGMSEGSGRFHEGNVPN